MSNAVSMTGNDTVIINGRILVDVADGDIATLTFPNDQAALKTGKNGNTIYAENTTGRQVGVAIRVLRGSADDKFLNNLMVQQQLNFANMILLTGEFIKQVGDGQGNVTQDTYVLSGGIFQKGVEALQNVEGNTDQSVCLYTLMFALAPRAIT